tara:strand:+ start:36 stop:755 length:720 start_codon:yes stop_codon:yes gene_type:complete
MTQITKSKSFPYLPPNEEIKSIYRDVFLLTEELPDRFLKKVFDKAISSLLLFFALPIFIILKILFVIEGVLIPENKGPMFFSYNSVSQGKIFPKYKIRIIKCKYIDEEKARLGLWEAYSSEWNPESRTIIGTFVKNFYLDELPQLYNILLGNMSFVGPRPLSELHYNMEIDQGNIYRKYIKGGLLGLGHVEKGTDNFGDPSYEYKYIDSYMKLSALKFMALDFHIILRGVILIFKGGGH